MTDDTIVERMARALYEARERDSWERVGIVRETSWDELVAGRKANPDPDYPHLYDDYIKSATALLPLVREAQAEAFESGVNTGIGYASVMAVPGIPEPENPYRTGDDHE